MACGILVSGPGMELLHPLLWKHRVLTAGPLREVPTDIFELTLIKAIVDRHTIDATFFSMRTPGLPHCRQTSMSEPPGKSDCIPLNHYIVWYELYLIKAVSRRQKTHKLGRLLVLLVLFKAEVDCCFIP